jgi:hypothetical protein
VKQPDLQPVERDSIESLAGTLSMLACIAFGAYIFFAIFSLRCLYADGSFVLAEVLKAGNFVVVAENRYCASFIFQLPVVVLLKLGLHNLYFLQLAFGVGCFLPWAVSMWFCHQMAPRHFWLVMLGCAAGYLNAAFLSTGEYIIAHAFFWPVLFAVLFVRPLTPLAAGMMVVSALILVFSYESLLFLGPPLSFLAVQRVFQRNEKKWAQMAFATTAALLLLAALVALSSVLYPQFPGNFGGFKRGLGMIFFHPTWTLGWTFTWLFLMVVVCLGHQSFTKKYFKFKLSLLAVATAVWGFWPNFDLNSLRTDRQYDDRSMQLLVPMALLMVAWLMTRHAKMVCVMSSLSGCVWRLFTLGAIALANHRHLAMEWVCWNLAGRAGLALRSGFIVWNYSGHFLFAGAILEF